MANKKVDRAKIYVNSTFNNTIITLTDVNGAVLGWSTPGTVGFKGSKKSTPYAAQLATERLLQKARDFGIRSVQVLVKGTGSGRNAVINALKGSDLRVEDVKNITPAAHSSVK